VPWVVLNAPINLTPVIALIPYIGVGTVIRIPPQNLQPYLLAKFGDMLTFYGVGIYTEVAFRVLPAPLLFEGVGFGVTANF
jgi:hypothetical protein